MSVQNNYSYNNLSSLFYNLPHVVKVPLNRDKNANPVIQTTLGGSLPSSAIDHVYTSKAIVDLIRARKIQNSATDHLPVLVDYEI